MEIRKRIKTAKPETPFEISLEQELLSFSQELSTLLNGGIRMEDNLSAAIVTIADSGLADTSNTVNHGLKRVPIGFKVININKAGLVYDAGSSWTDDNIFIKCNVANCTIKVMVF